MTFLSILPGLLLGALAIVMFGLGLSLAVEPISPSAAAPRHTLQPIQAM